MRLHKLLITAPGARSWAPALASFSVAVLGACSGSDDPVGGGGGGGGGGSGSVTTGYNAVLEEAQEVPAPRTGTRFRITVTNTAPPLGTFQTPVWIGFHDGSFELHDAGASADTFFPTTNALERLAEDGNGDPLAIAFAGAVGTHAQGVLSGQLGPEPGPIAPGESVSAVFELDPSDPSQRYLSYASMVIPSNDAFIANDDPLAHEIFDADGNFVAADFEVFGSAVLDAGTEVNDELPENTAFFGQTTPDSGVVEGGVVGPHVGFLAPGTGGILDDPMFANADFTAPDYRVLSVRFEQLAEAAPAQGLAAVKLTGAGSLAEFHISASGLSGSLTGAHFHMGEPGVSGPVLIDLSGAIVESSNGNAVLHGTTGTNPSFLDALEKGHVYVNLHTSLNPSGELRGQLTTGAAYQGALDMAQEVPAPVLGTNLRVVVQNTAPQLGTFQSPVWIGLHDGSFDVHDLGAAASTYFPTSHALERLAEDGSTAEIVADFEALRPGATQGVLPGLFHEGPIRPGEAVSLVFRVDPLDADRRFLSYASMILPSNDAFLANDGPTDHPLFDADGTFVGADFVVAGVQALDAGTEVNDELPENTAFFGQTEPDTGVDELGVVALHAGYLAAGMGGVLDDPMFANADFSVRDYRFLDVRLDAEVPAVPPAGFVIARLDEDASEITWAVAAHDLSGPATAMHFHRGVVGVAGPVLQDITSSIGVNADGFMTAAGTATAISAELVGALKAGEVYLNVHTALNPSGEIRGQVLLVE